MMLPEFALLKAPRQKARTPLRVPRGPEGKMQLVINTASEAVAANPDRRHCLRKEDVRSSPLPSCHSHGICPGPDPQWHWRSVPPPARRHRYCCWGSSYWETCHERDPAENQEGNFVEPLIVMVEVHNLQKWKSQLHMRKEYILQGSEQCS